MHAAVTDAGRSLSVVALIIESTRMPAVKYADL
jgi:hypothetical protein